MAAGLPWHIRLPGQPCQQAQATGASEVLGALRCQPTQEEQPPKSGLWDSEPCFLAPNLPSGPLPPSSSPRRRWLGNGETEAASGRRDHDLTGLQNETHGEARAAVFRFFLIRPLPNVCPLRAHFRPPVWHAAQNMAFTPPCMGMRSRGRSGRGGWATTPGSPQPAVTLATFPCLIVGHVAVTAHSLARPGLAGSSGVTWDRRRSPGSAVSPPGIVLEPRL